MSASVSVKCSVVCLDSDLSIFFGSADILPSLKAYNV